MNNPFKSGYEDHSPDLQLIEEALNGSGQALEALVNRHQHYIYNIAFKMVMNPFDAEDITQEVLIKMVTKLAQFQGNSNFKTWLYRITFNHFLKMKKQRMETLITTFDAYGEGLDQVKDVGLSEVEKIEQKEVIEEAKLSCMSGMLLCLNRTQRLVYILGEIFEADHNIGAELLDISKANFRKRLERARKDMYQFMNKKCGLINKNNPCRCARKTTGFIQNGWVDPEKRKFNAHYLKSIAEKLEVKNQKLTTLIEEEYKDLFQKGPFQEKVHVDRLMKSVLGDQKVRDIFNLN